MLIVTGGAGFIGSNLIHGLNRRGCGNIIVVDNLTNGSKARNLAGLDIADYYDKQDFIRRIVSGECDRWSIRGIFHQGACSDTMEYNGRYMMEN
ncbi:MAG: NAD-dependent epimerase/dehydratase family protein, partial [Negativicutes bacterium]|nr:NAD-dependent epimerase/dehydratase family protein [Negativicutes bacterium]